MRKKLFFFFLFIMLVLATPVMPGGTHLSGDYKFEQSAYKESDSRWNVNWTKHYLYLKMYSDLYPNSDAAFELGYDGEQWHDYWGIIRGRLKFKQEKSGYGSETYLYYKEDHMWLPNHIIPFTFDNYDKRNSTTGIKMHYWMPGYVDGDVIITKGTGDFSVNGDFSVFSIAKDIKTINLKTNLTYGRKRWGDSEFDFNSVASIYCRYRFKGTGTTIESEFFTSKAPSQVSLRHANAYKIDIRWLEFYIKGLGNFGYRFNYRSFQKNYRNYLYDEDNAAGQKGNEKGFENELYYDISGKAITFRIRDEYKTDADNIKTGNYFYSELWIGFIKGYSFKSYYSSWTDPNGKYPSLFFEVHRDLKGAWYKFQYKLRDIGTPYEGHLFGLENGFNLTDRWSFFTRILTARHSREHSKRDSLYFKTTYNFDGAQIFVEYGNSGHGDNDLTEDSDFADHDHYWAVTEEKIYMRFQIWF